MIVNEKLIAWIKANEGFRAYPYKDTSDHLTIGWGRNLENGVLFEEAELMFQNDLKRTLNNLAQLDWFESLPDHVKESLINMTFNLGISKLLTFKKMIAALKANDFTTAAIEALNSKWASEVGDRAKQIAARIRQP